MKMIGFVGLGIMGKGMLKNLVEKIHFAGGVVILSIGFGFLVI
jgi:3-hydroxyisobutyrate dehydrogenase-like beta-hydroxyacid dehydrogenase